MKISQELLGVVRDCKLFLRENRWPNFLNYLKSADRPATSAKSAIFDKNEKKKAKKSQKKMNFFFDRKWPIWTDFVENMFFGAQRLYLIIYNLHIEFWWFFMILWSLVILSFFWSKNFFWKIWSQKSKNHDFLFWASLIVGFLYLWASNLSLGF